MAEAGKISAEVHAENTARDDLRHAIAMAFLSKAFLSNPERPMTVGGINEMLNALERLIDAKIAQRKY